MRTLEWLARAFVTYAAIIYVLLGVVLTFFGAMWVYYRIADKLRRGGTP